MIPPWANYEPHPLLQAARRRVIEKEVEAKGLVPGTGKFNEVVQRKYSRHGQRFDSRYDAQIPPKELEAIRKEIKRQGDRAERVSRQFALAAEQSQAQRQGRPFHGRGQKQRRRA